MLKKKASHAGVEVEVESAGVGDWYEGHLADVRTRDAAQKRGLVLSGRARLFKLEFMNEFDYILAVDNHVLNHLKRFQSPKQRAKLALITHFSESFKDLEIPDPFYGNDAAFEHVFDILDDSCEGFIKAVVK